MTTEELAVATSTIWVVLAAVLVLFMQAGFAFLEAGLTRMKNVGHIAAKTAWNRSAAAAGTEPNQLNGAAPTASSVSLDGRKPEPPTRPLPPSPNAIPKPPA